MKLAYGAHPSATWRKVSRVMSKDGSFVQCFRQYRQFEMQFLVSSTNSATGYAEEVVVRSAYARSAASRFPRCASERTVRSTIMATLVMQSPSVVEIDWRTLVAH